jgi:hypothetical protein
MGETKERRPALRRSVPSTLLLFAITPVLLSVLFHAGLLICASRVSWRFRSAATEKIPESITILDIRKEIAAPIPGGGPRVERKAIPRVKTAHQPVIPKTDPHPGGTEPSKGDLDILTGKEETGMASDWLKVSTTGGTGGGTRGGTGIGGRPLHAGPGKPGQTFAEYIQALRERGLDVVIVLDSTSSMSSVMREVKQKIGNLALALRKLVPSCRVGLVTYRDRSDAYVTRMLPLTYGISSLREFLYGIEAVGGGDVREALDEGLKVAIDNMKWNRKSKAFILLMGDTPPHKVDIPRVIEMIRAFRKQTGGTVSVLDVRAPANLTRKQWEESYGGAVYDAELESFTYLTDAENVTDAFQAFAEAGGGESARLANEEKVVKHMLLYIFGTKWEAYLTEVMKNL